MSKLKILIADDNPALRARLAEVLSSKDEIAVCDVAANGAQALSMLDEKSYDVLLMDIVLQQVDGFGVLEALNRKPSMPRVVVLSALAQDDIVRRVCELGAYYFIIKPFNPEVLYRRIVDSFDLSSVPREAVPAKSFSSVKSLDERIANVFLSVGIPAHIKGYHFLREAVKQVYRDRSIINSITKRLYPGVAQAFSTSPSKVERAIRHAIEVAWQRGKIENINNIFGYTIYNSHEKPTNGEFIALVADKLITDDLTRSEQASAM